MTQPKSSDQATNRKISEKISEMAAGFIVGDAIAERQNRLNAACSAWNIACRSPDVRLRQLGQYMESYRQFSPSTSPDNIANIRKDMETLIERKLKMFPDDVRQIVSATVVMVENGYRIQVVAATFH